MKPVPRKIDIRLDPKNESSSYLQVVFNGEILSDCVAYDLDSQTVTVYHRDSEGKIYVPPDFTPRYINKNGLVEVSWQPDAPPIYKPAGPLRDV
jgi:hypothetical protein